MASKMKSSSEIQFLEKCAQFLSNFKVALQDIKEPTPEFVSDLYRRMLVEFDVDIPSLSQPPIYQMEVIPYEEMYLEVIPIINLLQALKSFEVIPEFGISDLVNPVPKRNLQQMTSFIEFLEFCDDKLREIHEKQEKVDEAKARQENLMQAINELKIQNNERSLKMLNIKSEREAAEKLNVTLKQDLKNILEEKEKIIKEIDKAKTILNQKKGSVDKLQQNLEEVEEEIANVESQVVDSPTNLVTNTEALSRKHEESKEALKNLTDKLQIKKEMNMQLSELLKKREETMLSLKELIQLIQSTVAKKKALETEEKSFSELSEKLEEAKGEKKKLLMKIENRKKELSDLKKEYEVDKSKMVKTLETARRECHDLEKKKEKAFHLVTSLEETDSKIEEAKQEFISEKNNIKSMIRKAEEENSNTIADITKINNTLTEMLNPKK